MLKAGDQAIDFSLPDQNGILRKLSDFRGQKVVLYFYPKDNTSGCTLQACNFAALYPQFQQKGAVVIGISKDGIRTHNRFAAKHQLPFLLLADPERKVLAAYAVLKPKKMYGKEVIGTVRSTFLIDENGIITNVAREVKADENPQNTLDCLSK